MIVSCHVEKALLVSALMNTILATAAPLMGRFWYRWYMPAA